MRLVPVSIGSDVPGDFRKHGRRVALVGLRGAGKSTLGQLLSKSLELPFIEPGREVERVAGMDIRTIHELYGALAYRRYEQRALEEVIQIFPEAVIATPGGLVTDPAAFNLLLSQGRQGAPRPGRMTVPAGSWANIAAPLRVYCSFR